MYYNTTNVHDPVLKRYREKAESQEDIIKRIFKNLTGGLTAVDVMYKFPDKRVPLTSIRRALSNLVDAGYLIKTSYKKEGLFGRDNYVFRLNTGQMTLF